MFLGKFPFWGKKNAFYPKTKVVPKTMSFCKTDENIKFSTNFFLRGVRGSWIRLFWAFLLILWPHRSPKNNIFLKFYFFICFTIAQSFWNNFCFWVKCIFLPQKKQFPRKHGFRCIFWQYSYNKSLVNKTSQSGIVALILDQFSTCQASHLGSPQWFNWGYCCSYEKTHYCNNPIKSNAGVF